MKSSQFGTSQSEFILPRVLMLTMNMSFAFLCAMQLRHLLHLDLPPSLLFLICLPKRCPQNITFMFLRSHPTRYVHPWRSQRSAQLIDMPEEFTQSLKCWGCYSPSGRWVGGSFLICLHAFRLTRSCLHTLEVFMHV